MCNYLNISFMDLDFCKLFYNCSILYGFCGMKIYSIKLRFDGNTLKGINRFRVIPSFLKLFRIILFTAGHLILDSVTTTLILLIFQIISFGIKYSYQIYEDPTF